MIVLIQTEQEKAYTFNLEDFKCQHPDFEIIERGDAYPGSPEFVVCPDCEISELDAWAILDRASSYGG